MPPLEELENAVSGNKAGATGDENARLGHDRVPSSLMFGWRLLRSRQRNGVVRSQARNARANELGSTKPSNMAMATVSSSVFARSRLAVVRLTPASCCWKLVLHSSRRR